jgi:hypothetical protein
LSEHQAARFSGWIEAGVAGFASLSSFVLWVGLGRLSLKAWSGVLPFMSRGRMVIEACQSPGH